MSAFTRQAASYLVAVISVLVAGSKIRADIIYSWNEAQHLASGQVVTNAPATGRIDMVSSTNQPYFAGTFSLIDAGVGAPPVWGIAGKHQFTFNGIPSSVSVNFGRNPASLPVSIPVVEYHLHPTRDLAIFRLASAPEGITPYSLYSGPFSVGSDGDWLGYGQRHLIDTGVIRPVDYRPTFNESVVSQILNNGDSFRVSLSGSSGLGLPGIGYNGDSGAGFLIDNQWVGLLSSGSSTLSQFERYDYSWGNPLMTPVPEPTGGVLAGGVLCAIVFRRILRKRKERNG